MTLSRLTSLSLVLIVALTSGAMAVARGQTHAAGVIVICSGAGIQTVAVDAEGNPVGAGHICPDCALGAFDHADAPALGAVALGDLARITFPISDNCGSDGPQPAASARGPPIS